MRLEISLEDLELSDDPDEAAQRYILLRQYSRDTFQSFLRNLNSKILQKLEQQFEINDGELDIKTFLDICLKFFPKPKYPEFKKPKQQDFIIALAAKMLYEDIDVDKSDGADWMEFVEFVCAIAECLRIQAEQGSGTQFDFKESQTTLPYRPKETKKLFDQMFYWPEHPADAALVFEEGQPHFHLHRPSTMKFKRLASGGHRSDLLAAAYMPDPFEWVATSGNDKQVSFWDSGFSCVKRWKMPKSPVSTLCWCPEIKALYFGTEHSSKIQAWRIRDMMKVRESEEPFTPDKKLELKTEHTKAVQALLWMSPLQCIATASLDASVRIFDLVQMQKTHELRGHTKGLTCLEYCPGNQILLSGGFDNIISMWDPGAGIQFHALRGHECSIASIQSVPNSEHEILSVDLHSCVKLWDIRRLACIQSFHATDINAEKSGEKEPLEPRSLCCLSRDHFAISGRRMVMFERDASNPRLTADSPIMVIFFSARKFEIATSVKNSIRIWCALTGRLLTVHSDVIDGNITAMSLGLGERRCFVGSDKGELRVINFACGAPLKSLTSHQYEVTEIQCIPQKVLTLSVGDKLVVVHDDTNPKKANILKKIDISSAGTMLRMTHDVEKVVAGGNEDGEIFWFAMDFAKQVSNSRNCTLQHKAPVSSVKYLSSVPLMCSADSESAVIFWSMQPLRAYEFFMKLDIDLKQTSPGQGSPTSNSAVTGVNGISYLAISWPNEDLLIVGTEHGSLACISIQGIVERARSQRDGILLRKESGEAAEVISGRIFDSMEKPCDSPEYVFTPENLWVVDRAHRGSIDQIKFCKVTPPVVLTLGFDTRVCLWHPYTGEALGTLEQGLAQGLAYERQTPWRFPIDAQAQVASDLENLARAWEVKDKAEDDEEAKQEQGGGGSDQGKAGIASDQLKKEDDVGSVKSSVGSATRKMLSRSESSPVGVSGLKTPPHKLNGIVYPDYSKITSRLLKPRGKVSHEWFAGPFSPEFVEDGVHLPRLQSGLNRKYDPKENQTLIDSATRLSKCLSNLDLKKTW